MFDIWYDLSFEMDVLYYNNLELKMDDTHSSIIHSGDNRDGRRVGDDEYIEMNDISSIDSKIHSLYLIININSKDIDFTSVETGVVSLYIDGLTPVYTYQLS